jgi:hypothetical protein
VKTITMDAVTRNDEAVDNVVAIGRARRPVWWLSAAAVFFLALFAWSELRLRMLRERLEEANARQHALAEDNIRMKSNSDQMRRELDKLTSGSTRVVALSGQTVAPTAKARVFMDEAQRSALVFFQDLPPNPNDKSYQLWVIRGDMPAPQAAGVFDVTGPGATKVLLKDLPVNTQIKAIAVTLEPKGGVEAPTGEKYLVGTL